MTDVTFRCVPRIAWAAALMGMLTVITVVAAAPGSSATSVGPTLAALAGAPAQDGARVVSAVRLSDTVVDLRIDSPAMRATMPVRVILPRSWSEAPRRRFPTLYLLQGASDDYTSWTRETDVEQLAARDDVIVAMPEGGRAGFYTDWWNYGRRGGPRWETFHTVELPQILEGGFRANRMRAVIGLSEGGLGALDYAARHHGEFRFSGSFSGIADIDDAALRAGIELTCAREGVDPMQLWGDPVRNRAVWNAHNPARMVNRFRGVRVWLSAAAGMPGPSDLGAPLEAGMLEGPSYRPTADFAEALRRAGVQTTAHLYVTGTHSWPYWQRELHLAWPSVIATLRGSS
jgi:S-formylglutathione hydrolase FrmB